MDFELTDAAVWVTLDKIFADFQRKISPYLVAVLTSALAALATADLWPELGSRYPLIVFYPAIAVSAWFGGLWSGVLATMLAATATYAWFAPRLLTNASDLGGAIVLPTLVAIGLTIAAIYETLRRRTGRAEQPASEAVRLSNQWRIFQSRLPGRSDSVAAGETEWAEFPKRVPNRGEVMASPPTPQEKCPQCLEALGRFLPAASEAAWVDYFRCDSCGHVWAVAKAAGRLPSRSAFTLRTD